MKKVTTIPETYRLIIAILLSIILLTMWQTFIVPKQNKSSKQYKKAHTESIKKQIEDIGIEAFGYNRNEKILNDIANNQRILVDTQYLKGSINLIGAMIDDITLKKYKQSIDINSRDMTLLSPIDDKNMYTTTFGWISKDHGADLPKSSTKWSADSKKINQNEEINLYWINKHGTKFVINISVDNRYMFKVRQTVIWNVKDPAYSNNIRNYISIKRIMRKSSDKSESMPQVIGVIKNSLKEISQDDLRKTQAKIYEKDIHWIGFSDKYWLVTAIPTHFNEEKLSKEKARISYKAAHNENIGITQIDLIQENLNNNNSIKTFEQSITNHLFIGAKELNCLEKYSQQYNIPLFDRAIDFGILYFITKPILMLLVYFYKIIGNFGLAILLLTIVVKIALFPLAHKGFKSMNHMKDLQPKIQKLRISYENNPIALQKAIASMYKQEGVSPLSGCLPILLQMPIFISLYKVLSITIEMRFAPFFGWIHDLSSADPTSIFNFFGLIEWNPPRFMMIGIMPILMGITMFIQQALNPQPVDPTQAKLMKAMPFIITYMFSSFPSGLVVYWTWSNILSIFQQILIKKLELKANFRIDKSTLLK